MIDDAPGRSYYYLSTLFEITQLLRDGDPTVHGVNPRYFLYPQGAQFACDLRSELPCRNKHQGPWVFARASQFLDKGEAEGGRFSSPGSGFCDDIRIPCQQSGNGSSLDGSWAPKPLESHRCKRLFIQTKLFKGHAHRREV